MRKQASADSMETDPTDPCNQDLPHEVREFVLAAPRNTQIDVARRSAILNLIGHILA